MSLHRDILPQQNRPFLTDAGLETTLVFHEKIDLPCFASFPLLGSGQGKDRLTDYFLPFLNLASRKGVGFVLDTVTWRANPDWASRLGYDADRLDDVQRDAVQLAARLRAHADASVPVVINGVVGPRGDGYVADRLMSAAEAAAYHDRQIEVLAQAKADMVSAITMTYPDEAIGIALAAQRHQMPAVISFTVETDGRLPSGHSLREAIALVDSATAAAPLYYMVNCAHPTHFAPAFDDDGDWLGRIGGIRANASTLSHAELDEATELDEGDPADLAKRYRDLRSKLKHVCVMGGCCGTDFRHVEAICEACYPA